MKLLATLHQFWRASFREEKAVFVVGLPLLFFFCGFEYSKSSQLNSAPVFKESKEVVGTKFLRVHIAGAVKKPALLKLSNGARIVDAVQKAGGATAQADTNALNLAAPLRDGQKIVVPLRGQNAHRVLDIETFTAKASTQNDSAQKPLRAVNINTASTTELESLPGVGPAIAARIVAERARKPFTSVQDIDRVNGIGPKKLQQIAPYITF